MRLELEGVGRLVERDPRPERRRAGTSRTRAVWRMFSSTKSSRPGVASADSSARSYWPSTRWPMNPSRKPSWRVVTQRLARAIDALASPPPGGTTWSSRSPSSVPMSARRSPTLARTQPARSTTAEPLHDPRQLRPERLATARARSGPSPRRTTRSVAAQLGGGQRRPGASRSRPIAIRSAAGQSTRPRRADRSARRPSTVAAAPIADADEEAAPARAGRSAPMPPRRPPRSRSCPALELDRLDVRRTRRRTAARRRRGTRRRRRS